MRSVQVLTLALASLAATATAGPTWGGNPYAAAAAAAEAGNSWGEHQGGNDHAGAPAAETAWAHPTSTQAAAAATSSPAFCLTDADAEVLGDDFAVLISNYNATFANLVLADNYTDQSASVNTLIDSGTMSPIPLDAYTFATKAAFLAGQGSQPNVPFTILNRWHTCDTAIIRWVATPGAQAVQGFDAIVATPSTNGFQKYQILTVYGEFNSGAWLADLGRPECNVTAAA